MKCRRSFSIRTYTILMCFSMVMVTFMLMEGLNSFHQRRGVARYVNQGILLMSGQKSKELDDCFSAVEQAVESVRNFMLQTIDEAKIRDDAAYGAEYAAVLSEELERFGSFPAGVSAMYFAPAQILGSSFGGVYLAGDRMNGFAATGLGEFPPAEEREQQPLLPAWSDARYNAAVRDSVVSYMLPVFRENRLLGVIGMDVSLSVLSAMLAGLPVQDMHVLLAGEDGTILYQSAFPSKDHARRKKAGKGNSLPELLSEGERDIPQDFFWDGVRHIGSVADLHNGMTVLIAVPYADIMQMNMLMLLEQAGLLLVTLAILVLLLHYAIAKLISPIKMLTVATRGIANGNLGIAIPYESDNEIGQLADSIRKMASQMEEYIGYIQKQTEREREAKEAALTESRSKNEFLASMYVSMHEIDLDTNTLSEILNKGKSPNDAGGVFGNADAVLHRMMAMQAEGGTNAELQEFVDFATLNARMKGKITISHEFFAHGIWYRGSFILVDKHPDGSLHHVIWAVENIEKERLERERLKQVADANAAASRAKSAFLANMSHEIRTPINAVLGMDEMILRECEDSTILGYALNIKNAGRTLLSIINDILDFSKIEAGKMEILPENYDLASVLFDLVNMVSLRAQEKKLNLVLDADPSIPRNLYGDSVRLKQCILNILTNAVKYTGSGSVTFTVKADKLSESSIILHISVRDTGSGIKHEDMGKLFSPFERIEEGRNRTIEGSGLGMSIVQKTLGMMGSRLEVRSEYGKGSEFSFSVEQKVTDWTELGDIGESFRSAIARIERYKETLYAPRARMLFVDDTEMNLQVIHGLLKNTGIRIDTVLSGEEALEKVQQNTYDILFIDHRMPGMDGIQTLREMQRLAKTPVPGCTDGRVKNLSAGKPCIALTANAIIGAKKMYLDEGFSDYLSKPVTPERLEAIIRRYLPPGMVEAVPERPEAGQPPEPGEKDELADIRGTEGINADVAMEHCGTVDVLRNALVQFRSSIEAKAGELQRLFEAEDWESYSTKVHALKSTSRLIGAEELSSRAAHLEHCADEGDAAAVKAGHGVMMELYRSYARRLEHFDGGEQDSGAGNGGAQELPAAVQEALLQKLSGAVQDFSIDGVDSVMAEFRKYTIPLAFAPIYDKIKVCADNVDFAGLKALLTAEATAGGEEKERQ